MHLKFGFETVKTNKTHEGRVKVFARKSSMPQFFVDELTVQPDLVFFELRGLTFLLKLQKVGIVNLFEQRHGSFTNGLVRDERSKIVYRRGR